jgi:PIN domain nuclease of toxin-antitoxin system
MRLLLDAHALIWALDDPLRLGARASIELESPANDLLLSDGTIWELGIKVALGKLSLSLPFREWMNQAITDLAVTVLPIAVAHVDAQIALPFHHRGPFDRLLAAQAQVEGATLVSRDLIFDQYGTSRLW